VRRRRKRGAGTVRLQDLRQNFAGPPSFLPVRKPGKVTALGAGVQEKTACRGILGRGKIYF